MKTVFQQDDKNDGDDHFINKMMMVVLVVVVVMMIMLMIMMRLLGNYRFLFSENLHFKSKEKRDFSRLFLNLPKKSFDKLCRSLNESLVRINV